MSRSRKKFAKTTWASGNNTEFYRQRNRDTRRKNRMNLRSWFNQKQLEEISDEIYTLKNNRNKKFDSWLEPTDGQYIIWKENNGFWSKENRDKLLRK